MKVEKSREGITLKRRLYPQYNIPFHSMNGVSPMPCTLFDWFIQSIGQVLPAYDDEITQSME